MSSDDPAPIPQSTMRRDIVSAYAVTTARIASWVILSSFVYRFIGRDEFALMAFVRATLGVLNYVTLGLAPAMVHLLAQRRLDADANPEQEIRASGTALAGLSALLGIGVVLAYTYAFAAVSQRELAFIALMGIGTVVRLFSDSAGAVLQSRGRIALDNLLLAAAEVAWVVLVYVTPMERARELSTIGWTFLLVSFGVACARFVFASPVAQALSWARTSRKTMSKLLRFGAGVTVAQLADYLYAPTDYLLIAALIKPPTVIADYAPALQIDSGLLLLVSALATVLFPKSALAHARGDVQQLRRYYIGGTAVSGAALAAAALAVYLLANPLFELWFHSPMVGTQAILPLVLISTVVGGSAMVGRSILLGMGKVKPFTISVLIAGVSNVILSYVFVRFLHLGLNGIIYGTIVAVVGRCAVWMPWYVLRTLRSGGN